ncbi:MAG TPA: hypothetical protein VFU37_23240 [Pyrinomonadaceae bacterium]|nr:hypothetical protein [Pyrinomonadaceae bacterium]
MNDNYLWDRSGEPDPEIQKLEELLGELRYQSRPLEIPADISIARRRNYFSLAIAAAIALMVIGAALWFQISRSQPKRVLQANVNRQAEPPKAPSTGSPQPEENVNVKNDNDNQKLTPPRRRPPARNLVAVNKPREKRVQTREPVLTPAEQAEKEQVLLALRLVSAKLNIAQRKVTGAPSNIIHNQHKIG